MPYGLPNLSYLGYPVSMLCAGHSGLGIRQMREVDAPSLVAHLVGLAPSDRRMRFCATLTDAAVERHIEGLWRRRGVVLAAHDGPLWTGPLHAAGPVRAMAELAIDGAEAEFGVSVEDDLRRRGVGAWLVQTAATLLAPRGVRRIRAYTLPGNTSFLALARRADAEIATGPDEVEVTFDIAALRRAYVCRRARQVLRPAA